MEFRWEFNNFYIFSTCIFDSLTSIPHFSFFISHFSFFFPIKLRLKQFSFGSCWWRHYFFLFYGALERLDNFDNFPIFLFFSRWFNHLASMRCWKMQPMEASSWGYTRCIMQSCVTLNRALFGSSYFENCSSPRKPFPPFYRFAFLRSKSFIFFQNLLRMSPSINLQTVFSFALRYNI